MKGMGTNSVQTKGSFRSVTQIQDENYPTTFHVVEQDVLSFESIIGTNILEQADIEVTQDEIRIKKRTNLIKLLRNR